MNPEQLDLAPASAHDVYVRLLVCLRPPPAVQHWVAEYLQAFGWGPASGRSTVVHRLHMTLLYCPLLHVGQVDAVRRALRQVHFDPLALRDFDPAPWDNGIAALLPRASAPLAPLLQQVRMAAQCAGILAQARQPATPHLTVARAVPPQGARRLPSLRLRWDCDAFEMVHSPAYPQPYQSMGRFAAQPG